MKTKSSFYHSLLFIAAFTMLFSNKTFAVAVTASQYLNTTASSSSLTTDANGNTLSSFTSKIAASVTSTNSGSSVISLGFTFKYFGVNYTYISFNTNGVAKLSTTSGATAITGTISTSNVGSGIYLSPFAMKMKTSSSGSVGYATSGAAPYRCFTIKWLNMSVNSNSTTADATFELKIYEKTGAIEFVYGSMAVGSTSTSGSATTTFSSAFSDGNQAVWVSTCNPAGFASNNSSTGSISTFSIASNVSLLSNKTIRFYPPTSATTSSSCGYTSSSDVSFSDDEIDLDQDLHIRSLHINDNSKIWVKSGRTLTVDSDIVCSSNGYIKGDTDATIIINGSGSGSHLRFDQTTDEKTNCVKNFTLNRNGGSCTIENRLVIFENGKVTLSGGQLILNDTLKLKSTCMGNAMIDKIPRSNLGTNYGGTHSNASYDPISFGPIGCIKACRHIPAIARKWRFIGSPIRNTHFDDMRKKIFITGAGSGTTIGQTNNHGFDACATNSPSVYTFNESTYTWGALTNSTSSLSNQSIGCGTGYRVFVRGDRSDNGRLTGTNNSQNEVTIEFHGNCAKGDINLPVSYTPSASTPGWCLVSNPYPAGFDWKNYYSAGHSGNNGTNYTNIDPTVYVYNPSAGSSYVSYNALSNTASDPSFADGVIHVGSAFFTKTTGSSPSLKFTEDFKCVTPSSCEMFKTATTYDQMYIKTEFDSITFDNTVIKFMPGSTNGYDAYDMLKKYGDVNLAFYDISDSTQLIGSIRPAFKGTSIVPMNITSIDNGTHKFTFSGSMFTNYTVVLFDAYTSTSQPIFNGTKYSFTISSSNPLTFGKARFKLIISSGSGTLPVTFLQQNAVATNNNVDVKWSTASELNNDHFDVEFSNDAVSFNFAGTVKGAGNSTSVLDYNFTHFDAFHNTKMYYRIKQVNFDGTFSYGATMAIEPKAVTTSNNNVISFYPVPAVNGIHVNYAVKSKVAQINIIDINGKTVSEINNPKEYVDLSSLENGNYFIHVLDVNGNMLQSEKLIIAK